MKVLIDVCVNGHERTSDNVDTKGGCRKCSRKRASEWKREQPFPCGHERSPENTRHAPDGSVRGCAVCPTKFGQHLKKDWTKETEKYCKDCDSTKPLEEFYCQSRDPFVPSAYCKSCTLSRSNTYRKALSSEERSSRDFQKKLKRFGLTEKAYFDLLEAQNGLCFLCQKAEKTAKSLAIDHDHITGKVRGLLCTRCNLALGWYEKITGSKIDSYLERGK